MLDPEFLIKSLKLQRAKVVGDNLMSSCPFPEHKDSHPSFGINLDFGAWNCYGCEEKGRKLDTIYFKLDKVVPLEYRTIDGSDFKTKYGERDLILVEQSWLDFLTENPKGATEELHKMGRKDITRRVVKIYNVGFSKNKGSLFFPIMYKGILKAYIERNRKWEERYRIRPAGTKKGELMFGVDQALKCQHNQRKKKSVILVEGPTDVLQLASHGIFFGVATCGTFISNFHIKVIVRLFDSIMLLPDNGKGGDKWTKILITMLKRNINVRKLFGARLPMECDDPGEASKEQTMRAIQNAKFIL